MPRGSGAVLGLILLLAGTAGALDRSTTKRLSDRTGNWLVDRHNLNQGTFGSSKQADDPGMVALVLKALCDSPRDYREGHGPFITQPLENLLKQQRPDGAIGRAELGHDGYATALAIEALVATRNPAYAEAIARARAFLVRCQAADGGFGYGAGAQGAGDLSNTRCALAALRAAGEKPDQEPMRKALGFLRRCQDLAEVNPDLAGGLGANSGGGFYKPGESAAGMEKGRDGKPFPKPYGSMTAALLESYLQAGLKTDAPEVQAALKWLGRNFSAQENPGLGQEGYFAWAYLASRALRKAGVAELDAGDGRKINWANEFAEQLNKLQKPDWSFVNREPKWLEDDPALCTAYALEALTACYRIMK